MERPGEAPVSEKGDACSTLRTNADPFTMPMTRSTSNSRARVMRATRRTRG